MRDMKARRRETPGALRVLCGKKFWDCKGRKANKELEEIEPW